MKKVSKKILISALIIFVLASLSAGYATAGVELSTKERRNISGMVSDGRKVADEISKAVGISISPLMGISFLGAYTYLTTSETERSSLPWYNRPGFWLPLLIFFFLFVIKDSSKFFLPIPKTLVTPLDLFEIMENKVSGILGLLVVLLSVSGIDGTSLLNLFSDTVFSPAYAAAVDFSSLGPLAIIKMTLLLLFVVFCFFIVWLVSHAINILIIISPFSTIDMLLKMFRNAVISLLLVASLINPYLGLVISLMIVLAAYFAAGFSFRLMVFGALFFIDIFFGKSGEDIESRGEVNVFSSKDLEGVPFMSYGVLRKSVIPGSSGLEFIYRPWLIAAPRRVIIDNGLRDNGSGSENRALEIGRGTLSSIILKPDVNAGGGYRTLFRMRSIYRNNEIAVSEITGIDTFRDVGIVKNFRESIRWLKENILGV